MSHKTPNGKRCAFVDWHNRKETPCDSELRVFGKFFLVFTFMFLSMFGLGMGVKYMEFLLSK